MSGRADKRRPHALVIPFPAQGHVGPMMHLSIKLAAEAGFTITFVTTHHIHTSVAQALEPRLREQGLANKVRLVQVVNDKRESGDTTGRGGLVELCRAFYQLGPSLEELAESLLIPAHDSRVPPLTCIISDLFLYFTQDIASKFGLDRVAFWTASAAMLAGIMEVVGHGRRAPERDGPGLVRPITWIPGAPPLRRRELNEFLLRPDPDDFMYSIYLRSYSRLRETTCIAVNTFDTLEPEALAALRDDNSPLQIYTVGPLLPPSYFDLIRIAHARGDDDGDDDDGKGAGIAPDASARLASYPVASLWKEDDASLRWLDRQARRSVLYVSFGSIAIMSAVQFEELALGLEESRSPILWVIRPDLMASAGGQAAFPDGFLQRTKEQIFVVEWAPQLQVLAHAAVGGFLSHCGWNSTLESLSAGVPILGWPYFADQMLNNRLLVDSWGLGLEFERADAVDAIVTRDQVTAKVQMLLSGSEVVEAAARLRDAARAASQPPHGSSSKAFARLADSLLG
jgi:hypothetical protein